MDVSSVNASESCTTDTTHNNYCTKDIGCDQTIKHADHTCCRRLQCSLLEYRTSSSPSSTT
eukprot:11902-Heterococcus_DN1.PRE.5